MLLLYFLMTVSVYLWIKHDYQTAFELYGRKSPTSWQNAAAQMHSPIRLGMSALSALIALAGTMRTSSWKCFIWALLFSVALAFVYYDGLYPVF